MKNEILEKMKAEADSMTYAIGGIEAFSVGAQNLGDILKDEAIGSMRVYAEYLEKIQDRLYTLITQAEEGCK